MKADKVTDTPAISHLHRTCANNGGLLNDEAMVRSRRTGLTSDANDRVHWRITCAARFGQR